ncbi:hypothetical protein [Photobacterium kishitanii]|nr:hypothetical protein [Photobacterium kishitanii]
MARLLVARLGTPKPNTRHLGSEVRAIRDLLTTCLSPKDTSEIIRSTTRG